MISRSRPHAWVEAGRHFRAAPRSGRVESATCAVEVAVGAARCQSPRQRVGANAQATTWWTPPLVAKRVSQRLRGVRFDWRDNGLSTWIESDAPNYGLGTSADDVLDLLDHLGIEDAQLVGCCMGGRVAQVMATTEPARVRSLTLLSTTTGASELPPVPAATCEVLAAAASMDPEDAAVRKLRHMTGDHAPSDERAWRSRAGDLQARGQNPHCRHADAILAAPDATASLAQVVSPTLVIHGEQDPLRPLAHGRAVASAIRESTLAEIPVWVTRFLSIRRLSTDHCWTISPNKLGSQAHDERCPHRLPGRPASVDQTTG